jgi:hypothetical protein
MQSLIRGKRLVRRRARYRVATMQSSDWIALVQSAFLALAAVFAWRAYRLARTESSRAPRRQLIADAVHELKGLAAASEEYVPGAGMKRLDVITGHQRRLAVALAFMPWAAALQAWEATAYSAQEVDKDVIDSAAADLNYAMRALDAGLLDGGEYLSADEGDRAPIRHVGYGWRGLIWRARSVWARLTRLG